MPLSMTLNTRVNTVKNNDDATIIFMCILTVNIYESLMMNQAFTIFKPFNMKRIFYAMPKVKFIKLVALYYNYNNSLYWQQYIHYTKYTEIGL